MICILSGNYLEAVRFAEAQNLSPTEWFFPLDEAELSLKSNFHVIVVGSVGENTPPAYFNRIYELAQKRGRIGRG